MPTHASRAVKSPAAVGLSLAAALAACETAAPVPAPAPAAPEVVSAAEPPVEEIRAVRGRITGHDGAPLEHAAVKLQPLEGFAPPGSVPAGPDGEFVAPVEPDATLLLLRIAGPGHAILDVPVDLRDPAVELDIRLGTAVLPDHTINAFVSTPGEDPNAWSGTPPNRPVPSERLPQATLKRGPDGVLTATVRASGPGVYFTPVVGSGPGMRPVPAPRGAPEYHFDGYMHWALAPAQGGTAELRLDPARMPPPGLAPQVTVLGEAPRTATLVRSRLAALAWGPAEYGLPPADPATCARAAAEARAAGDEEWIARWMYHAAFAAARGCELSADDARRALERIDPAEELWSLADGAFDATAEALKKRAADRPLVERYEEALIARHASDQLVAGLLFARLVAADGDPERARGPFAMLRSERFRDTFHGSFALSYDPDGVKEGKPAPEFTVPAPGGGPPLTRTSLLGRPYLLEFWGTWCEPCVEMMPELHAGYAELHGVKAPADAAGWQALALPGEPPVAFVSIAVHDSPEALDEFRRTQWPMPWLHGLPGDGSKDLMELFRVGGVPTMFFVDATGMVVQREGELAEGLRKLTRGGKRRRSAG